eukprot:3651543-Ditylum_brightwellii.AAC.1
MSELKDYLENTGIGSGELTEAQVKEMIDTAAKIKLASYPVHLRDSKFTWLPDDFEFLSGTAWYYWEQCNRGNVEQKIPPLCL